MLERMGPPEYVHKFYKALRDQPGVRFLARKSGTWEDWHADSALLEHDERRFVVVALAKHEEGDDMLERVGVSFPELSKFLAKSAREGQLVKVSDKRYFMPEAVRELSAWIREGKLTTREHVVEGIESFHRAFLMLFSGENFGKLVLKVGD